MLFHLFKFLGSTWEVECYIKLTVGLPNLYTSFFKNVINLTDLQWDSEYYLLESVHVLKCEGFVPEDECSSVDHTCVLHASAQLQYT